MGTLFSLTLYATNSEAARIASEAAFTRVSELNAIMTDYDPESELMRLSRSPAGQPVQVSEDLFSILAASQEWSRRTDGAFDITIGPLVRQWRRVRRTSELPSPEALARARQSVGWKYLRLDAQRHTVTLLATNMQLDLGGIAKGWAADAALQTLRRHGVSQALIAASGDIAAGDAPPGGRGWRVGLGLPGTADARTTRDVLLVNAAVSTSGDTEQFVEIQGVRYSHILDPRTGLGITNGIQASVVASRAGVTDPLATSVCVLGWRQGGALVKEIPSGAAVIAAREPGGLIRLETVGDFRQYQPDSSR